MTSAISNDPTSASSCNCSECIDYSVAEIFFKRLAEIKDFHNLSINALQEKTSISRGILDRMLKGIRFPLKEEKQKLIHAFELESFDRLLGQTPLVGSEIVEEHLQSKNSSDQVLELIKNMKPITGSEALKIYYYKARALQNLERFDEAEQVLSEALLLIQRRIVPFGHPQIVMIYNEFCQLYFYTNRPEKLVSFTSQLKESKLFPSGLIEVATIKHYEGLSAYQLKNYGLAMLAWEDAAELYRAAGALNDRARVLNSMAHLAVQNQNYDQAINLYKSAIQDSQNDLPYYHAAIRKDYARLLVVQNQLEDAAKIITDTLSYIDEVQLNSPEMKGKLLLLKSEAFNTPQPLEELLRFENSISPQLRMQAHFELTTFYMHDEDCPFCTSTSQQPEIPRTGTIHEQQIEYKKVCTCKGSPPKFDQSIAHMNRFHAILREEKTHYAHYRTGDWF